MDKCNWSNLLLNWVNHTEFSTTYYDTLEQTDIKSFFEQFKQSFTVTAINEDTIYEFLKVHFPSFQYHLDDLNELSSLDYVYVYSLLMYFGCVKCPDPHFHNTCQRLSSHQQSTIASFLGIILNNNRFDHNSIRSAISQTSPKTPIVMSTESPLRGFKMDMSPPTPKTSLLEDKSRETHFLKAQLDTERYERGVLEILLKQSEEKIEKLTQNQKKHIETNHKLQSQILQHTTENVSPTKNIKEEQIKKKLRKEISSKEETIIALKSEIENLVDHNKEVNDKLAFTKTQMSMWIEKSRLFEQLMEDIKEELDRKNELIKILQEANGDLQNFIRETRNSPENGNGLNNSSGDFLDLSLSRVTAASSETFSPENLGRSVVDVQLREKEIENNLLKENIQQMWLLFERHRSILNFDDNVDHGSFGDAFAKFAEKFESHVGNFKDLQKMAEELSIEKNVLSNENMEVEQRLKELSNVLALEKIQNEELSMKISKLTERSNELEITEKHLSQLLDETNNSVQNKAEENRQLLQEIMQIKESNAKLETQIRTSDADALQLKSIIQSSSEQLDVSKAKISQLESNHQDISTKNIELLKQIDSYISQIEVISNTNCTLNEVNKSNQLEAQRLIEELTAVGQSRHSEIETLTCNTELVKSQNDELNQIILQLRDENKEIKNDMNVLIQKLDAIKAEKIAIEVLFEKIKLEYEEKIVSLENEIARLKSQINALETSQAEQKSEIVALQQERKEMNCDTILIIDNLQERNDTLKKENGELQSEREKLTKDFEGAKLLNELLQDEKHLMASKCELSNEKLGRLEAALKNHEERNGELSQKMSEMKIGHTNALQDAEAKSKVLEANCNDKQLEVDRLTADLEAVTSHKTKLETEIERFQNEFASQSIKYDCDVKELEIKLKSASSELQRRASEVEQMREAQIKLEENVASLNSLKEVQQEKISQLENDNALLGNEFAAEIADKNEQIRMYETASSELEAKLQITNGEIQKNSDKILSTNSELLEARSKCSELRAECAKIQAQHSELEQEKIELFAKIEMLENSAAENTKKIEKVESVNSALTTSVAELKVIESANAKVIADLETKLELNENMGAELNTAKSENSAVTQKLSEVEKELAARNTDLRNSEEKIQVLEENLKKIEVKNSELEGEKLEVISKRDDLQRISADANAKLQKLKDLNANLETIKKSSETMIAELETKLESISQESETQLSMAETQKTTITQKISELEEELTAKNTELRNSEEKIQVLEDNLKKVEVKVTELEGEKLEVISKRDDLQQISADANAKLQKLEDLNANLEKNVNDLEVIRKSNETMIAELETKLDSISQESETQLSMAETQKSTITQKISELEEKLTAKNTELRNSEEKIQVLEDNLKKVEVKVSELEVEKLEVISKRDDLQKISADANAKLQKLEDLNANLEKNVNDLEVIKKSNESVIAELETKLKSISQESVTQLSMAETEKSTISQKISELEVELTAKNIELRNSEEKIQVLEDNLKKVEVKVTELEVEKLEVISKRDDLQKISADADAKLQKLEDLNANLEANKKSNETMIVELETKLKSAETRIAETEAALVDKLNSALGDASKLNERLKQTNKSLQDSVDQVETLTRSIAELKCQLAESVQAKADNDIELTKLQSEFITLQDATKSTEQSCQSATNRLETELMTIQKENESFKLEIDHLMKSEAAGQESINNLKSEVNIAILEKSELSENLESKIRELETNEATLKVTVEALESQLESQTQDNIKIRNNIKQLEEKKNGLEVRITELLKSLETKISQFSDRLLTAGEEHNTMMQNMNELKQQLADCEEEKLALEQRIRELDAHLERLRATSNVDKSTIAELTANLASKHIECDALSADYKKTKEEMQQLTFEIKSKETAIDTLKFEITEKQCSIASVEKEKFQLTNEIASFQNRETQLSALQSKLEQFEEAHEELNLRYQKQMLQLSISEEKNKELAQRIVALEKEADEYKVNYTESVEQITTLETTTKAMQQEFAEYKTKTDANNLADLADLNELVKQKSHAIESLTNEATITAGIIAEHEQKVKQYEKKLSKVIDEKRESEKKIDELADVILEKQTTITEFERRLNEASAKSSHSNDEKDQLLEKEKELTKRLLLDVAIFQAKLYKTREVSEQKEKEWLAEKEVLLGKVNGQKSAEDAIQENRIELVGKLDKMKAKMKTLYTEEMSKVKVKYESELARQQTDHQKFTEKYDVHIQKLSKQIYQLNEDKLELQKENEMAKTKIRFLENNSLTTNPRVSNILQPPQSFGSTNLRMEDEEGEMFNNTYLTDLKTGNSSAWLGRDSVRLSELQYRNSLMPPHLRSSYLPQYGDQNLREEDIKDPPIGFDDSLNSLLQSGQRKKLSGATAYKRPGPPTPSKNAGRLSLGSVSIDREVLKETNDNNYSSNVTMRKNTPGKLMSLFSSSKAKDENSTPKRRISIFNKRNSNVISKRY